MPERVVAANAFRANHLFVLRAHICVIGADMIARQKLMMTLGNRAKSYCEYCNIVGLFKENLGIRCCHHQPIDVPANVIAREQAFERNGHPAFQFGPGADDGRANAPLRDDATFRAVAREIQGEPDARGRYRPIDEFLSVLFGIKGLSVFAELSSVVFPWSFPPDFMHLILLGLLKKIHKHLTGKEIEPDEEESLFVQDYIWEAIARDQKASKSTYPAEFGDSFDINKAWTAMKAANWYSWAIQQALVYLRSPTALRTREEYEALKNVTIAVELASKRTLTWEEVDVLDQLIREFLEYFELRIYRYMWIRIKCCKPTYHGCSHIGQGIRMCGPMPAYWQFKMEEKIGLLGKYRLSRC